MKMVIFALLIFIIIVSAVFTNSIVLGKAIEKYERRISEINIDDTEEAKLSFSKIYDDFKKVERYISLTVTHEDLTNIEEMFAAAIGAAEGKDTAELAITKSRLCDALGHLRRLVGVNPDSILEIGGYDQAKSVISSRYARSLIIE